MPGSIEPHLPLAEIYLATAGGRFSPDEEDKMRTGFARQIRLLTAVGLVAGLLGGPLAVPSSATPSCTNDEYVSSLYIELKPLRKAYRPGETAAITARVSRTSFDSGAPYTPAAGVDIMVMLDTKERLLYDGDVTGKSGTAELRIRLPKSTSPGPAHASAYAWRTVNDDVHCFAVSEEGHVNIRRFLKILAIR
ncbi:MAG: hypothetical protein M3280_01375 [Actinomycetota bacterium]|nr:hypothetical protein [Actinomycetota bacterium]